VKTLRQLLIAERRELLALCRTFGAPEWNAPTLCTAWRVRDVVAHVISGDRELLGDLVAAHGDLDVATERGVARRRDLSTAELLAELAGSEQVASWSRVLPGLALLDNWVHHEDIRRPMGRGRAQDPERLKWVLRYARFAPSSRGRGLCLVPTDLDVVLGRGPEVVGAAADLVMGVMGRPVPWEALMGRGAPRLRQGPQSKDSR
jgi:uncharacterized protein (TIGR03083 family)